jgi:glycerol 3-phosphatase-2
MLADGYDAFLLDLDGVLFRGATPIAHAPEAVRRLREMHKGIAFVTNNSSRTPGEVAEHLRSVGIEAAEDEIASSAVATAELLAARGLHTAFVIGERGIRVALAERGIEVVGGAGEVETGTPVDAVLVGFDRSVDYDALRIASVLVERGAPLIATNGDGSFPASDGTLWPGAGALLAAVEATTGVRGEVVGKPHAPVLEAALRLAGGGRPLVVGDRLDTDVAGAAGMGWDSALVLTGVSRRHDLGGAVPRPTYVLDDLAGLFENGAD